MGRFRVVAAVFTVFLGLLAVTPASAKAASAPAYATVMFGRTGWAQATGCGEMAGTVDLGVAVGWLSSQGIPAAGGLTTGRTKETTEFCESNYILYPSWAQLEQLQSSYGFQVISQSADYTGWKSANTDAEINAESCATIPTFKAHGFTKSWGMFAFPDNSRTDQQIADVNQCFAFDRVYSPSQNSQAKMSNPPYRAGTVSVTSGNCNDKAAACATKIKGGKTYMLPARLSAILSPKSGQYNLVQFYRFVSGSGRVGSVSWDCTSPNPNEHWVNYYELYCYNDFQAAVMGHGAGVTFTDPATVATALMPARAATLANQ
jgi:hypothetical protein